LKEHYNNFKSRRDSHSGLVATMQAKNRPTNLMPQSLTVLNIVQKNVCVDDKHGLCWTMLRIVVFLCQNAKDDICVLDNS
jgi:hypothetical protein